MAVMAEILLQSIMLVPYEISEKDFVKGICSSAGALLLWRSPMKICRPCSHIGCHELTTNRYCDKHETQHQVEEQRYSLLRNRAYNPRRPEYHRLYHTAQWARLRRIQLSQQPWCAECLSMGVRTVATVVDHTTPHKGSLELFYDTDRLNSLCKSHHDQKTAHEDGGFGNQRKS